MTPSEAGELAKGKPKAFSAKELARRTQQLQEGFKRWRTKHGPAIGSFQAYE